jgi:beta-fructofuranosidase
MIGDYDTVRHKFAVTDGGDFNFGPVTPGGMHAPSACPDPENSEAVIGLFNMNPGMIYKNRNIHWNQIMSLPRRWTLCEEGRLKVEPAGDIESLRKDHQRIEATDLPINSEVILKNVSGNAMELLAYIDPTNSKMIEMKVLRSPNEEEFTRILFHPIAGYKVRESVRRRDIKPPVIAHGTLTIDATRSSTHPKALSRPPEVAPVLLDNVRAVVKLRVFVDRSIVEIFVNDRQCAAVRVYPGRKDSTGVSLRAIGGNAKLMSLDAWQMKNIYE